MSTSYKPLRAFVIVAALAATTALAACKEDGEGADATTATDPAAAPAAEAPMDAPAETPETAPAQ